jgi:hypothetical protein
MTEKKPVKRGRGRPRIHHGEMVTISIKVPQELAKLIRGSIAFVKLWGSTPMHPMRWSCWTRSRPGRRCSTTETRKRSGIGLS